MNCPTSACEGYKQLLVERSLDTLGAVNQVIKDWSSVDERLGLMAGAALGPKPATTAALQPAEALALTRVQKAVDYLQGAKEVAGTSKNNLPVLFDGEFATKQLLGAAMTPGGKQINFHAADRMVNPPKGREPMTILEVEYFIDTADKIRKIKIDDRGTSVTLMNSKYPKAQIAVDGSRIIMVVNPVKKK